MSDRRSETTTEPTYTVRLLPEIREAVEAYAREQNIPASVVIAEAVRCYVGRAG